LRERVYGCLLAAEGYPWLGGRCGVMLVGAGGRRVVVSVAMVVVEGGKIGLA